MKTKTTSHSGWVRPLVRTQETQEVQRIMFQLLTKMSQHTVQHGLKQVDAETAKSIPLPGTKHTAPQWNIPTHTSTVPECGPWCKLHCGERVQVQREASLPFPTWCSKVNLKQCLWQKNKLSKNWNRWWHEESSVAEQSQTAPRSFASWLCNSCCQQSFFMFISDSMHFCVLMLHLKKQAADACSCRSSCSTTQQVGDWINGEMKAMSWNVDLEPCDTSEMLCASFLMCIWISSKDQKEAFASNNTLFDSCFFHDHLHAGLTKQPQHFFMHLFFASSKKLVVLLQTRHFATLGAIHHDRQRHVILVIY